MPAIWKYEDVRADVMASGALISAEEAVRRVLILENPGLPGQASITQSLYAGLQLILPGEIAPSHRHTQSALRFIVEGRGAYTAVNGERTTMRPGDFIITPSWTWHDHGNADSADGGEPVVWLDGLDIPLLRFLDAGFAENYPSATQPVTRPEGDSMARYGHNMAPVRHQATGGTSPIFNYPYERSREALDQLYRHGELDPGRRQAALPEPGHGRLSHAHHGHLHAAPARRLPGQDQPLHRLHRLLRGGGPRHARIGEQEFHFGPRDVFVAPSWQPLQLAALEDATLFSYSDRPVQAALGVWRKRAPTNARPRAPFRFPTVPHQKGDPCLSSLPRRARRGAVAGSADRYPVRRVWRRNYAAHAREMGFDPDREPPFFFCKPADAVVPVA